MTIPEKVRLIAENLKKSPGLWRGIRENIRHRAGYFFISTR
jgi:hypothetical protein